ncbi:hypothetical protein GCM10010398_60990 [Streptomyces fimbriatus]
MRERTGRSAAKGCVAGRARIARPRAGARYPSAPDCCDLRMFAKQPSDVPGAATPSGHRHAASGLPDRMCRLDRAHRSVLPDYLT